MKSCSEPVFKTISIKKASFSKKKQRTLDVKYPLCKVHDLRRDGIVDSKKFKKANPDIVQNEVRMIRMSRNPRAAYEWLTTKQLKAVRVAFEYDMFHNVKTEESKLFVNTRIAIIDKILEDRDAK